MRSHSRSCMSEVGVRDGQSPYSQPVCSDRECHLFAGPLTTECIPANQFIMVKRNAGWSVQTGSHLLAGLSSTECIPAGQFKIVKHNAGRSVQTGNAIYWPVC